MVKINYGQIVKKSRYTDSKGRTSSEEQGEVNHSIKSAVLLADAYMSFILTQNTFNKLLLLLLLNMTPEEKFIKE